MIATTVTLRIFFYGLIAFTPDEFVCGGLTRALLPDAQSPTVASDGCLLHPHEPVLYYRPRGTEVCSSPCIKEQASGLCRCRLTGNFLIDIPDASSNLCNQGQAGSGARDFDDLVPRMSRTRFLNDPFDRSRLRKECDNPSPTQQNPLCNLLEAQLNFHPTDVKACRKIQGDFEIHPLEGTNPREPDYKELAEVIVFEVPIETENPAEIKLKASNPSEGSRRIKVPTFDLESKLHADIAVTNEPAGSHVFSGPCDATAIARDFALFYDLAASPPDRLDRSVPQARGKVELASDPTGLCRQSILLEKLIEKLTHAGNARPICPEVSF